MIKPPTAFLAMAWVGWPAILAAGEVAEVAGWGAADISPSIKAMWLSGAAEEDARQALVLALYRGPDGWHDVAWEPLLETAGTSGRIVLASQDLELSLAVDPGLDRVEVQGRELALSASNVFVVEIFPRRKGRADIWPKGRFDDSDPHRLPLGLGLDEGTPELVASLKEEPDSRGAWFSELPGVDLVYGGFLGGVQELSAYLGGRGMSRRWSGPEGAVELGLGGGKLSAGWFWIRPKDSALKYSATLAVLRSWGDPALVEEGQTLFGLEASAAAFVFTGRVGVFRGRRRDGEPQDWILSLSFGVGL